MADFHWHHRTIRYIDSRYPEDEPIIKAHEFSYDVGTEEYSGFTFGDSVAQSQQEAEWIAEAFKHPPVVEADYATIEMIESPFGNPQPTFNYKWLDRKVV